MANLQTLLEDLAYMVHEPRLTGQALIIAQRCVGNAIGDLELLDLGGINLRTMSLTLVAGQYEYSVGATTPSDPISLTGELPADFLFTVDQALTMRYPAQTTGSTIVPKMGYMEWVQNYWSTITTRGTPQHFAMYDRKLLVGPAPTGAHKFERLNYRKAFTRPSPTFNGSAYTAEAGSFTNDLFTAATVGPSIYDALVARTAMYFTTKYLSDPNAAAAHNAAYAALEKQQQTRAFIEANAARMQHLDEMPGFAQRRW